LCVVRQSVKNSLGLFEELPEWCFLWFVECYVLLDLHRSVDEKKKGKTQTYLLELLIADATSSPVDFSRCHLENPRWEG
jgi:hypothetical protein